MSHHTHFKMTPCPPLQNLTFGSTSADLALPRGKVLPLEARLEMGPEKDADNNAFGWRAPGWRERCRPRPRAGSDEDIKTESSPERRRRRARAPAPAAVPASGWTFVPELRGALRIKRDPENDVPGRVVPEAASGPRARLFLVWCSEPDAVAARAEPLVPTRPTLAARCIPARRAARTAARTRSTCSRLPFSSS